MATELRRSDKDRVLFGVCGGLGDYFKVDPVLVRVGCVLLAIAWGAGVILYLVLAVLMPRAGAQAADARVALGENVESIAREAEEAARRAAGAFRQTAGGPTGDADVATRRRRTLAAMLIAGGAVLILANVLSLWWRAWGVVWPALLVLAGVLLLLASPREKG